MSAVSRPSTPCPPPPARMLRDPRVRIQQLLALGREHCAAGQYEQAVHVWTRILLLERDHSQARFNIDRARQALAEQQRKCDEVLHTGIAALGRGETETARRLLRHVLHEGGARDEAALWLERTERMEASARACDLIGERASRRATVLPPTGLAPGAGRLSSLLVAALAVMVAAATMYGLSVRWQIADDLWSPTRVRASEPLTAGSSRARTVSASEAIIGRARALLARGQLQESLRTLEDIKPGDALGAEADVLRRVVVGALVSASPRLPAGVDMQSGR